MKKTLDLRIKDDPKIWSKAPRDSDDALDYLFERLIEQNAKIEKLGEKEVWGVFDAKVRKRVRPAQEALLLLYRLDSEVQNGGMGQLCWNSPEEVKHMKRAFRVVALPELAEVYKKAEAQFLKKEGAFFQLWQDFQESPVPDWSLFKQACKVVGLGWFDKAYISKHRATMVDRLVKFVLENKSEFVK